MKLHLFNPQNDLALADGNANYCAPPSASKIAYDLASLPIWFADTNDYVLLPDKIHIDHYNSYSRIINLPKIFNSNINDIAKCVPWGWSPQIKKRLRTMGFEELQLISDTTIDKLRQLSNRRTSIKILQELSNEGIDIPQLPQYITKLDDVGEYVCSMPLSVIKAPWSGSGKGIAWGLGRKEIPVEHFAKGIIRKQGGVICEKFLNKIVDFAMEFFLTEGKIYFKGYSLFNSVKGVYSGNILASDNAIEDFLSEYIQKAELLNLKEKMILTLENLFSDFNYTGYLGVDMLIYKDENDSHKLNPCVELNLRMNMGAASRILFDKYIGGNKTGIYKVDYFKQQGKALAEHNINTKKYPLILNNGKIESGYLSLSPVTEETQYMAYIIIDKNQNSLSSLYNR